MRAVLKKWSASSNLVLLGRDRAPYLDSFRSFTLQFMSVKDLVLTFALQETEADGEWLSLHLERSPLASLGGGCLGKVRSL